jgi:MoaA/NifB/PqqE/SkfB family radical SAM enzyme
MKTILQSKLLMKKSFIANKIDNRINAMQARERPDIPISILLEPTNACNLTCRFCSNPSSKRRPSTLNVNLARSILEEAFSLGVREAGFYLTGEPLLHPHLEDLILQAKRTGFQYIYLSTNGILAKQDRVVALAKNGLNSIKFSINAGNRSNYQKIHGLDAFYIVLKNLQSILERRNELASLGLQRIMVSSVLGQGDDDDAIIDLKEKLESSLDDYVLYHCLPQPKIGSEEQFNDLCPIPFTQLYVTSSGMLTLCCRDSDNYLAVADLSKQTLRDAWYGELAQGLRRRLLKNNLGYTLCARCLTRGRTTRKIEPLAAELYLV